MSLTSETPVEVPVRVRKPREAVDAGPYVLKAEIEIPLGHRGPGRARVSPDGSALAVATRGSVKPLLVDLRNRTSAEAVGKSHRVRETSFGIDSLEWSPDGASLVTAQSFDAPRIWRRQGGGLSAATKLAAASVGRVVWSPDGDLVAFACPEGDPERKIIVCSADSGAVVRTLDVSYELGRVTKYPFECLGWSADGIFVSTGAVGRTGRETIAGFAVRVVDPDTGRSAQITAAHDVVAFACAADGDRIAFFRGSGEIVFAHARSEGAASAGSVADSRDPDDTSNRGIEAWAMAWSRDGKIVVGGTPGEIVVISGEHERLASIPVRSGIFDVSIAANGDTWVASPWHGEAGSSFLIFERR